MARETARQVWLWCVFRSSNVSPLALSRLGSDLLIVETLAMSVLCVSDVLMEGNRDGARGGDSSANVGVHLHQPGQGHARTLGGRGHQALGVGKR